MDIESVIAMDADETIERIARAMFSHLIRHGVKEEDYANTAPMYRQLAYTAITEYLAALTEKVDILDGVYIKTVKAR